MKTNIILIITLICFNLSGQPTISDNKLFYKDSLVFKKLDSTLFSGLKTEYYFNNSKDIWYKQYYLEGVKNGIYEVYSQQGDTIEIGAYKNGLKDGLFIYFGDDKKRHHIEKYKLGQIEYFDKGGKESK